MRDATKYLIGPKNFTSFTDDKECKDPIRKITNIKIVSSGEKCGSPITEPDFYIIW